MASTFNRNKYITKIIKRISLIAIVCMAYVTLANNPLQPYSVHRVYNNAGYSYVYIRNNTPNTAYCFIRGIYGTMYFQDFYVRGYRDSRPYLEPNGRYQWQCKQG